MGESFLASYSVCDGLNRDWQRKHGEEWTLAPQNGCQSGPKRSVVAKEAEVTLPLVSTPKLN